MNSTGSYTVIIPVYNEAELIEAAIQRVQDMAPGAEIIVVDGGSTDATVNLARCMQVEVVYSKRGRGIQCNAGAKKASGDVLLFLHADTSLPENAFELLNRYFLDTNMKIGTFRLSFDQENYLLRFYSRFTKFDSIFTRFGDQCIVVRKSFLHQIGNFPDWPLFEDVHLLRTARHFTNIVSFPASVTTSARRFLRLGLVRTQLINAWLLLLYFFGVSPKKLAIKYASIHGEKNILSQRQQIARELRNL